MPSSFAIKLPPPRSQPVDLLIVAGEHSGDQHMARVVEDLLRIRPKLNIAALGGPKLERAGVQLIHDLTASSVVGLAEVLKNYFYFRALFGKTVKWIEENQPKTVCLVDYPGFNLRLAKKLYKMGLSRQSGGSVTLFYYISPQVWAWNPVRRFEMARLLDGLGAIFPFEEDCYKDTSLQVRFVGHPFVEEGFQLPVSFRADGPLLLLPGSRREAAGRIFPPMLQAFRYLHEARPDERAVTVYPDEPLKNLLEAKLTEFPGIQSAVQLVPAEKGAEGKAALASSGTISMACALAGIPAAVVYRTHPLTYFAGRALIKVPYLGIANILLERPLYREYIQEAAEPGNLTAEMVEFLDNPKKTEEAQQAAGRIREMLQCPAGVTPADWLVQFIR